MRPNFEFVSNKEDKMKKTKRITMLYFVIVLSFVLVGCTINKNQSTQVHTMVSELHNGDAKFYKEMLITSVGGKLCVYDLDGNLVDKYDDINVNWLDTLEEENIIIYGNGNNELGIVQLDDNQSIISNSIIINSDKLMIDPTIIKIKDSYYITYTEIEGTINNPDPNGENGKYTIWLYRSTDLKNWEVVSEIADEQNNLEDIDIAYFSNKFYVFYEKEMVDKGNSSIVLKVSKDSSGQEWEDEKVLIDSDCDHEPASVVPTKNGYRIYYSCDKNAIGESYMGGEIFCADFNSDFELINKDIPIGTENKTGILLYDFTEIDGKEMFLYSKDYLTNCDMVVEER